jgi:hypothetical protein
MIGMGPTELATLLAFAMSLGGAAGLPLSTPPLPPDPVVERAAPDACVLHLATAGVSAAQAGSENLTEKMLADEEMREFLGRVASQITALLRQTMPAPPEVNEAAVRLLETALARPLAITVERFQPRSPERPAQLVASLLIRTGPETEAIETAMRTMAVSIFDGAPEEYTPRKVEVGGADWQQVQTPIGPLSWGLNDGSLVLAIGPDALESLLGRLADGRRKQPAWKTDLEKRMPVSRRSTLAYLDAGAGIRTMSAFPSPDREQFLALLDASGIATLDTVGAISGMTAEGISASIWLGFQGRPTGVFAAPATGIGPDELGRIPADAMMAQAWSLDLSKTLAMGLALTAAIDPQAAESARGGLEQFRAVAGLDLDTHLLKPLGPDWTLFSLPAPGGMLPNLAIVAGVRDRPTFAKTHKALLGILRNVAAEGTATVLVRELPYRGKTLFCLEVTGEDFAMPLTPTWCLTDDSLVITASPQLMKTLLARDAADGGIGRVPEVKAALAGGEPALVGAVDPGVLIGMLCGLYEIGAPLARGLLREQGLEIDLPQLPRSTALMPYARPSVSVVRHEADGIVLHSTGTVPLGPLTAGGGVLGLSPATTPVLIGLLLPAVQSAREAAQRAAMQNNFKQVVLAMLIHEDARRRLPAQAICDADGKPLLSWRVAVLPFLDEGELYEQFRLDEPWDSEHNRQLIERMPAVYGDPSAPAEQAAGLTTIQVLTGKGTPFAAPGKGLRLDEISDGTSKTVAVVEATANAVPWTKPDDIEFDPERPLAGIGNPRRTGGLFITGFFDGHVETIMPEQLDPEVFKAFVTPAGGEPLGLD